jgi:hypothetical protein
MNRPEVTKMTDPLGKIRSIYEIVFQRYPTKEEFAMAQQFVKSESEDVEANTYAYQGAKRRGGGGMGGRGAIQNEGLRVARRPLNAWETFTQVLLLSNEAAYVN